MRGADWGARGVFFAGVLLLAVSVTAGLGRVVYHEGRMPGLAQAALQELQAALARRQGSKG